MKMNKEKERTVYEPKERGKNLTPTAYYIHKNLFNNVLYERNKIGAIQQLSLLPCLHSETTRATF